MFLARAASIASNASTTEHDELPSEYNVVVEAAPTGCAELDLLLTSAERAIVHTTPGAPASQQLWVARALASRADGLFTDGKAANDAGDVEGARKLFEHAFLALPRVAYLLSVANMHLKADAPDVARAFYLRVLQTPHSLPTPPPTEAEQMARRNSTRRPAPPPPRRRAVRRRVEAAVAPSTVRRPTAPTAGASRLQCWRMRWRRGARGGRRAAEAAAAAAAARMVAEELAPPQRWRRQRGRERGAAARRGSR